MACKICGNAAVAKHGGGAQVCPVCASAQRLPVGLLERVDDALRDGQRVRILELIMGETQPALTLIEAQTWLGHRLRMLGLPSRVVDPVPPLDELVARAKALGPNVAAIEAVWEGDTTGWFVVLVAVVVEDGRPYDKELATIVDADGDVRLFERRVPPWPEAVRATALGTALAHELGLPFFFGAPDSPDDRAPRWHDRR